MDFKNLFFFLLCCFLAYRRGAEAFNITQLLSQYPDFTQFNNFLKQTGVAASINDQETVTVLVVDNGNMSPLSSKSKDVLMDILTVHVIMDYFDIKKLQNLPDKSTTTTTLFQKSGRAKGQQGFVNITDSGSGSISIGSAAQGSSSTATIVKSVYAQPYNISVLQISAPIVPQGIDGTPPKAPAPAPKTPAPAPAPAPKSPAPAPKSPAPAPAPSPKAKSPAPAQAPSPRTISPSGSPAVSPSPSGAPAPSQSEAPSAEVPSSDAPASDAPEADHHSGAGSLRLNLEVVFMVVSVALWLVSMI